MSDSEIDALVQDHMRLVESLAKLYERPYLSRPDLLEAGREALHRAARAFDPTSNHSFVACSAWWVREALDAALKGRLRANLSQERVVAPIVGLSATLAEYLQTPAWADGDIHAVACYVEKMLTGEIGLMGRLEGGLSDCALSQVEPLRIQEVCMALVRDLLRHRREQVAGRIGKLCRTVSEAHGLSLESLSCVSRLFELENTRAPWARELLQHPGVDRGLEEHAAKLVVVHSALVTDPATFP